MTNETKLTTVDIVVEEGVDTPDSDKIDDDGEVSSPYPPFTYWDELRSNPSIPFETQQGSSIIRIESANLPSPAGHRSTLTSTIRLAHIASMLGVSWRLQVPPIGGINNIFHNAQAAGVLALKHLNERSPRIMKDLPNRIQESCPDLFFTMDLYDTQLNVIHAAQQFSMNISHPGQNSLEAPQPTALAGATRSLVTKSLAILSGVQEIPSISHISAADSLDNTDMYPYFCRTSASNAGMARGLGVYLHSLGEQVRHVAILYARDELGISHYKAFADTARKLGISVFQAPYEIDNPQSLEEAIKSVLKSGYRYVSLAPVVSTFPTVAQKAYELGLGGENYTFFLSEGNIEVVSTQFALNATTHNGAASILNGTGIVLLHAPGREEYQPSMTEDLLENAEAMQYFTRKHPAQDLFLDEKFMFDPVADAQRSGFAAALQHSQYDAIIALGLAACDVSSDFFTGTQLYESIKNQTFTGASEVPVRFKEDTCSRDMQFYQYLVFNLVAKEADDNGMIKFDSHVAAMLSFDETLQNLNESVTVLQPHIFRDGSSTAKPSIPDRDVDMNLIPRSIQIIGWVLAGVIMVLSLSLGVWTVWKRNTAVVRMRQPIFLFMCCAGAFIMASSIIPMSLQEPTANLDVACMSSIWLVSVGFLAAFAALFSKTWRVNRLYSDAKKFRRKTVLAKDVILPFIILTSMNLILLVAMTIIAPLEWKRQPTYGEDQYGRYLGTYGRCTASNDKTKWFFWSLILLNFLAVLLSNIQIFLSRNLPSSVNQSKDVAFSMLMLMEACLVGVPVLVVVEDSPTARFLVSTSLVVVVSLAILVPQVPIKVKRQREVSVRSTADPTRISTRASIARRLSMLRSSNNGTSFSRRSTNSNPSLPVQASLGASVSSFGANPMHAFSIPPALPQGDHDHPQQLEGSISSFG